MNNRFDEWKQDIRNHCEKNNLSFEKAGKMIKSFNDTMLFLQYYDPESAKNGLGVLDETPMPTVLWITKHGNELIFEQTEYTRKYLAK